MEGSSPNSANATMDEAETRRHVQGKEGEVKLSRRGENHLILTIAIILVTMIGILLVSA